MNAASNRVFSPVAPQRTSGARLWQCLGAVAALAVLLLVSSPLGRSRGPRGLRASEPRDAVPPHRDNSGDGSGDVAAKDVRTGRSVSAVSSSARTLRASGAVDAVSSDRSGAALRQAPPASWYPCACHDPKRERTTAADKTCGTSRADSGVPGLAVNTSFMSLAETEALLAELTVLPIYPCIYGGKSVQEYGMPFRLYTDKNIPPVVAMPPLLRRAADRLFESGMLPTRPNYVLVHSYAPGQGIWPHTDDAYYRDGIASLTLSGPAPLEFSPNAKSTEERAAKCVGAWLPVGSVFAMTGDARYEWNHQMPARLADLADGPGAVAVPRQTRWAATFRDCKKALMEAKTDAERMAVLRGKRRER